MSVNSDPELERLREPLDYEWADGIDQRAQRGMLERAEAERIHLASSRRQWLTKFTAAVALGIAMLAWSLTPAGTPVANGAPVWTIEVTSAGPRPVSVLMYDESEGWHLLTVPGSDTRPGQGRMVSARLANGELHMVSLGWWGLKARSESPASIPGVKWNATSRFITAFQNKEGTGVRATW